MQWLKSFKTALLHEDIKTLDSLLKDIPEFKKIEDMREAYSLIGEAKNRFEEKQKNIQKEMNKIEQTKKYLNKESEKVHFSDFF